MASTTRAESVMIDPQHHVAGGYPAAARLPALSAGTRGYLVASSHRMRLGSKTITSAWSPTIARSALFVGKGEPEPVLGAEIAGPHALAQLGAPCRQRPCAARGCRCRQRSGRSRASTSCVAGFLHRQHDRHAPPVPGEKAHPAVRRKRRRSISRSRIGCGCDRHACAFVDLGKTILLASSRVSLSAGFSPQPASVTQRQGAIRLRIGPIPSR